MSKAYTYANQWLTVKHFTETCGWKEILFMPIVLGEVQFDDAHWGDDGFIVYGFCEIEVSYYMESA